jgi:membrane protein DedA with SNARE-associated domain
VAAGVFRVRYPVFLASVVLSTAIWAGAFMTVGIVFGSRVGHFLQIHRQGYVILPIVGIIGFAIYLLALRRRVSSLPPAAG